MTRPLRIGEAIDLTSRGRGASRGRCSTTGTSSTCSPTI
jgi:hypothetical protein